MFNQNIIIGTNIRYGNEILLVARTLDIVKKARRSRELS